MPLVKDYVIGRELGHGGAATVYLAHHRDDPDQSVALKVLHITLLDLDSQERFNEEAVILNHLQHPDIATVIDQGVTESDQPFFAMTYWPGMHITEFADHHQLDVRQRLGLFLQLCDLVSFAHRNLVLHRDIKPGNVLVTPHGVVKLLDFGIAKMMTENPKVTALQDRRATYAYASPEQVEGKPLSVTSEVYSLGMLLYKLLTGRPAYELKGNPLELVRVISEQEPLPSSTLMQQLLDEQQGRGSNDSAIRERIRLMKGDLDIIVMKALRKAVAKRYATVASLADDIRRFLDGLPIHAKRPTRRYRFSRFVRRHRVLSLGAFALVLTLFAVLVSVMLVIHQNRTIRDLTVRQNIQAQEDRETSEQLSNLMTEVFSLPETAPAQGDQITASMLLKTAYERAAKDLQGHAVLQERFLTSIVEAQGNLGLDQQFYQSTKQLLGIQEDIHGPDSTQVITTLLNMSPFAVGYEGIQQAIDYAEQAFTRAKKQKDPYYTYCAGLMLANYSFMAPTSIDQPVAYADSVLAKLEQEPMDPLYKMLLYMRMGDIYLYAAEPEKALIVNQKAYQLCKETCGDDHQRLFTTTTYLAKSYEGLGRHLDAIRYAEHAIQIGEQHMPEAARTYEEPGMVLANSYEALQAYEISEAHYLTTMEKVASLNGLTRYLYRIRFELAEMYRDWGRYQRAMKTIRYNLEHEDVATQFPFVRYISQFSYGVTLDELGLGREAVAQLAGLLQTEDGSLAFGDRITTAYLGRALSRSESNPDVADWVFQQATQTAISGPQPLDWDYFNLQMEWAKHGARQGRAEQVRCLLADLDHHLQSWVGTLSAQSVFKVLDLCATLFDCGLVTEGQNLRAAMVNWPALPIELRPVNQHYAAAVDLLPKLTEGSEPVVLAELEHIFGELCGQDMFPQKQAVADRLMAYYRRSDRPAEAERVERQLWGFLAKYNEADVALPVVNP